MFAVEVEAVDELTRKVQQVLVVLLADDAGATDQYCHVRTNTTTLHHAHDASVTTTSYRISEQCRFY